MTKEITDSKEKHEILKKEGLKNWYNNSSTDIYNADIYRD